MSSNKILYGDEGEESDDSSSSSSSSSASSSTSSCNTVTDENPPPAKEVFLNREGSPVFYLDPEDWMRVEGSSPLPPRLLHSASTPCSSILSSHPRRRKSSGPKSLHILFESEAECTSSSSSKAPVSSSTPPPDVTVSLPSSGSFASILGNSAQFHTCKRRRKVNIPILCARAAAMADSGGSGGSSFGSPFGNPLSMSTPGNRRSLQDVDALGLFLQGKTSNGRHLSRCISDDVRRRSTASLISSSTYHLNQGLSSQVLRRRRKKKKKK